MIPTAWIETTIVTVRSSREEQVERVDRIAKRRGERAVE